MSVMPIVIFADGAAKGNPGPGGFGVIVVTPSGGEPLTAFPAELCVVEPC